MTYYTVTLTYATRERGSQEKKKSMCDGLIELK